MTHSILAPDRLAALRASDLLDTPPDPVFDRLTILAAKALKVPVALLSLVDSDRQFFKSQCGLPSPIDATRETPLSHSFCQHVVTLGDVFIVNDAREHPLVQDNPAVAALGIIAYAGVPIRDASGQVLGSFCAIDGKPRVWSDDDIEILQALAAQAMTEIAARSHAHAVDQELAALRDSEADHKRLTRLTVHDLHTPLHSLLLNLQAMPLIGELNALQRDSLAIARRSGEALVDMVDTLLDIDSVDQKGRAALRLASTPSRVLVQRAVEVVSVLGAEKEIRVDTHMQPALPPVICDRDRIGRVLLNLLGNAIKFTRPGGHVRASTSLQDIRGAMMIVFAVSDTGIGIAAPDVERIFLEGVRLSSSDAPGRSWGLGLAFCKRVVEAHGGRIWVKSEPSIGSTFFFTLPTDDAGRTDA
jgi:signal transduction histidine kinase